MSNGAVMASAHAAAIANAIKASGTLVSLMPAEFMRLLDRAEKPLVVHAPAGFFGGKHAYLMGHRGLAFYTNSPEPLRLEGRADIVEARKIWIPFS